MAQSESDIGGPFCWNETDQGGKGFVVMAVLPPVNEIVPALEDHRSKLAFAVTTQLHRSGMLAKHTFNEFFAVIDTFTRPRVMKALAKLGFTQSYSYFTWRNEKSEIMDYFAELTTPPESDYYRANLFTNTPDIFPVFLQTGGQPAYKIRAVLATTLSSVYGMFQGFELCEGIPVQGKEEYLNSDKYEIRTRDWRAPGNIVDLITRLNRIRHENPALQEYDKKTRNSAAAITMPV